MTPSPQQPVPPGGRDPVDISFATFYQGEMPYLVRTLIKCGANEQDAADAAQQAFVLLLGKWNTVSMPRAWLRTVSIRQLLPALIIKRQTSSLDGEEENYAPGTSPPVATYVEFREEERLVLGAIHQLPPAQRKVFALSFDGFGSSEIAEILQMNQAAVRQNLARARAALKELLGLVQSPSHDRRAVHEFEGEAP